MSMFNQYFANHFGSCRLLAYARDPHRERDVKLYVIPGHWDCVGVTDGTDCWIAPSVKGHLCFKNVDVWQLLADLHDGKLPTPKPLQARRRLLIDDEPAPTPAPAPRVRRRISEDDPQPQRLRRHHVEV